MARARPGERRRKLPEVLPRPTQAGYQGAPSPQRWSVRPRVRDEPVRPEEPHVNLPRHALRVVEEVDARDLGTSSLRHLQVRTMMATAEMTVNERRRFSPAAIDEFLEPQVEVAPLARCRDDTALW